MRSVHPLPVIAVAAAMLASAAGARAEGEKAGAGGAWGVANATMERVVASAGDARVWIGKRYEERPLLMLGLVAGLSLPLLAVAGGLIHRRRTDHLIGPEAAVDVIQPVAEAWIEVEGAAPVAMPESRDFLQIGRHEDNDVRIDDESVHRYHAVIERSLHQGFVIVDVSGPDGNGLIVNGERLGRAALSDGDMVELGRSKLRFQIAA